jgi:hypothetical protein
MCRKPAPGRIIPLKPDGARFTTPEPPFTEPKIPSVLTASNPWENTRVSADALLCVAAIKSMTAKRKPILFII